MKIEDYIRTHRETLSSCCTIAAYGQESVVLNVNAQVGRPSDLWYGIPAAHSSIAPVYLDIWCWHYCISVRDLSVLCWLLQCTFLFLICSSGTSVSTRDSVPIWKSHVIGLRQREVFNEDQLSCISKEWHHALIILELLHMWPYQEAILLLFLLSTGCLPGMIYQPQLEKSKESYIGASGKAFHLQLFHNLLIHQLPGSLQTLQMSNTD